MVGLLFVLLLSLFFYYVYKSIINANNHWKNKGVPHVAPTFVFGNFAQNLLRKAALSEVIASIYRKFPNQRFIGFYQFTTPILLVRDADLIKKITVKDFEYFSDHTMYISPEVDPLWGRNLFSLSAKDGWHEMRAVLSPTFTSSKMRSIFTLMQKCVREFVAHLNTKGDSFTLELKDTFSRVGNDVIGSTAFGVECNSLTDRENEFYMMGKIITGFSGLRGLKFFAHANFPRLTQFFKVKLISTEAATFFRGIISDTLRFREKNNIVRPDMIHLLREAKKERDLPVEEEIGINNGFSAVEEHVSGKRAKFELTDELITAQALIFFFAGFDTVSTALSLMFYELALNPKIQEHLHSEIRKTLGDSNTTTTYEQLLSMNYLDCVVSESLRLHPPGTFMDRRCVKPYVIEPEKPNEPTLRLEKGDIIWLPAREIHRDPQFYPESLKFDPERFSSENKHKINPFCYMPFGLGPRNCIASRFALLECKLIIVEVMKRYEIVPVSKTEIPLTLSPSNPIPLPTNGIWMGLNRRKW